MLGRVSIKKVLMAMFMAFCFTGQASHQRALDMYYDHLPGTNNYIFTVRVHYSPTIPVPTEIIETNAPFGTIAINMVQSIPVTENCIFNGAINIYKSDTINLGTIPTTGYTFWFSTCCRQLGVTNILISASSSHYIETTMFPISGQSFTNSSPRFINPPLQQESPIPNFRLSVPAMDPDNDSLFYKLVPVKGISGNMPYNLTYNNGYSFSEPLGLLTNMTIDQNTGKLSATNVLQLYALINVQVEAYNQGSLISSVQFDFMTLTKPNTSATPSIVLNNASSSGTPLVFKNGGYYVSLTVGDSISFDVSGNVGNNDSLFLGGMSPILSNTIGSSGSCVQNCAIFSSANFRGISSVMGTFKYKVDMVHFQGKNTMTYPIAFSVASKDSCSFFKFDNIPVYITLVSSGVSIKENSPFAFSIYPNPANNYFTINRNTSNVDVIKIYDLRGRTVHYIEVNTQKVRVDVSHYQKGIYIIKSNKGPIVKLVVQ